MTVNKGSIFLTRYSDNADSTSGYHHKHTQPAYASRPWLVGWSVWARSVRYALKKRTIQYALKKAMTGETVALDFGLSRIVGRGHYSWSQPTATELVTLGQRPVSHQIVVKQVSCCSLRTDYNGT